MSRQVGRTSATTHVLYRGWVKTSQCGVELRKLTGGAEEQSFQAKSVLCPLSRS